jgi:hypothetical protein
MFQTKGVEEMKTHRAVYEVMWKHVVERRSQYGACALHAGDLGLQIHSGRVMLTAFPLQQWLHERASALRYTYSACLVLHMFRCTR